jgi:hypothetical protein
LKKTNVDFHFLSSQWLLRIISIYIKIGKKSQLKAHNSSLLLINILMICEKHLHWVPLKTKLIHNEKMQYIYFRGFCFAKKNLIKRGINFMLYTSCTTFCLCLDKDTDKKTRSWSSKMYLSSSLAKGLLNCFQSEERFARLWPSYAKKMTKSRFF